MLSVFVMAAHSFGRHKLIRCQAHRLTRPENTHHTLHSAGINNRPQNDKNIQNRDKGTSVERKTIVKSFFPPSFQNTVPFRSVEVPIHKSHSKWRIRGKNSHFRKNYNNRFLFRSGQLIQRVTTNEDVFVSSSDQVEK